MPACRMHSSRRTSTGSSPRRRRPSRALRHWFAECWNACEDAGTAVTPSAARGRRRSVKKKPRYQPLGHENPDSLEKEVLDQWKKEDLFRKTLEATRKGKPFVFFEGPPTANGRPGIHHVFARTIKDLICRYHTLLGE